MSWKVKTTDLVAAATVTVRCTLWRGRVGVRARATFARSSQLLALRLQLAVIASLAATSAVASRSFAVCISSAPSASPSHRAALKPPALVAKLPLHFNSKLLSVLNGAIRPDQSCVRSVRFGRCVFSLYSPCRLHPAPFLALRGWYTCCTREPFFVGSNVT